MAENKEEQQDPLKGLMSDELIKYLRTVDKARMEYIESVNARRAKDEQEREGVWAEEDKGLMDLKEDLLKSKEMREYLQSRQDAREKFIRQKIEENLTPEDMEKFKVYEELADYFAGQNIVKTFQRGDNYENIVFGVIVYGEEYFMREKDIK